MIAFVFPHEWPFETFTNPFKILSIQVYGLRLRTVFLLFLGLHHFNVRVTSSTPSFSSTKHISWKSILCNKVSRFCKIIHSWEPQEALDEKTVSAVMSSFVIWSSSCGIPQLYTLLRLLSYTEKTHCKKTHERNPHHHRACVKGSLQLQTTRLRTKHM